MYGSLPDNPEITVAAGKPYVFIYSSWYPQSTLNARLTELGAPAKDIKITTSGLTTVQITLTPLYNMPLSAWRTVFESIGLSDLTDFYVGTPSAPEPSPLLSPVKNVTQYWGPKITALESSIGAPLATGFNYIKIIAIASAVAIGGIVILTYVPKPRRKENDRGYRDDGSDYDEPRRRRVNRRGYSQGGY